MVKIPEAVSVLEKAVREAPLWPEIYLDMGKAYQAGRRIHQSVAGL
jgi:hypothetical protein